MLPWDLFPASFWKCLYFQCQLCCRQDDMLALLEEGNYTVPLTECPSLRHFSAVERSCHGGAVTSLP